MLHSCFEKYMIARAFEEKARAFAAGRKSVTSDSPGVKAHDSYALWTEGSKI
jgi:hypothetical protein